MVNFPAFKIGLLLIKQVSKPIASYVKKQAAQREGFRRVIIKFAQGYHRLDVRLKRRQAGINISGDQQQVKAMQNQSYNSEQQRIAEQYQADIKGQSRNQQQQQQQGSSETKNRIRPLEEGRAIELAANLIGETFIFSVAVMVVILETYRKKVDDDKKQQNLVDLERRLSEMESRVTVLSASSASK
ncbi:hypothetical protein MIR68_008912 [Amoeboaphelidium protococcarum]|nr:hypothetical protein MIR68_008912 [Amoeboaphelidium protococcarum]KAI3648279.1 hypothetical protein MP228_006133 [Amoeboaphelidium protococcarum]